MGGEITSFGALVPTVKSEPSNSSSEVPPPPPAMPPIEQEIDKDMLCPICMQIIKDAFLTACGHSFCYMCIVTHLQNKSDCPCCLHFLTANHIYPNFLLNKLLMKTCARQKAKTASPLERLRQALEQGCKTSVKDLDSLLSLISEKKHKMEQLEAEANLQILLDFMHSLRKKKLEELNEIQTDLHYIKEDIHAVERRRMDLYRRRDRYSGKLEMLVEDLSTKSIWPLSIDKHSGAIACRAAIIPGQSRVSSDRKADARSSATHLTQRKDTCGGSDSHIFSQSELVLARKRRVHVQFKDLQDCYLQKRRYWGRQMAVDSHGLNRDGYSGGLDEFQSVLSAFTRYMYNSLQTILVSVFCYSLSNRVRLVN